MGTRSVCQRPRRDNPQTVIGVFAGLLEKNKDDLAARLTSEMGKPITQARNELTALQVRLNAGSTVEELLEEDSIQLATGDVVVLYTDGITEAMNPEADLFGDARLSRIVEERKIAQQMWKIDQEGARVRPLGTGALAGLHRRRGDPGRDRLDGRPRERDQSRRRWRQAGSAGAR